MAKISFFEGVQCRLCGEILQGDHGATPNIFTPELCQNCGAHLINMDVENHSYDITPQGRPVIIKRTHKLFNTYIEVVREMN